MEPLPQRLTRGLRSIRWGWVAAGLMLASLVAGCVNIWPFSAPDPNQPPPPGEEGVCRVVTTWYHEVVTTPDPTHGGAPVAGLAGRLYLFGPEIQFPQVGDGSLNVDLYNDGPTSNGESPIMLEEWRIDRDTLRRLLKKDTIGWGYTLFLPWGTYRPDIKQVHLNVRYEPLHGTPLFTDSGPLSLNPASCGTVPQVARAPAGPPPPAAPAQPPAPVLPVPRALPAVPAPAATPEPHLRNPADAKPAGELPAPIPQLVSPGEAK